MGPSAHRDDVQSYRREAGHIAASWTDLGIASGSVGIGLRRIQIDPGCWPTPAHVHGSQEEIFFVLGGEGTVLLGDEAHNVSRGHAVSRPPGTRVAHAFRAGDAGLTYLAFGSREPNDIAYYPRSGKVYLRGVGVMGRLEQLDYWDGEEE